MPYDSYEVMIMTKNAYRNAIKSENSIKQSLMSLLQEGHYIEDISVKEICAKADVTRGTFYNHYKNTNEVTEDIENDFINELTKAIKETGWEEKKRKTFFDCLSTFLEASTPVFSSITKVLSLKVFMDVRTKLHQAILNVTLSKDEQLKKNTNVRAKTLIFVNGLAGAYLESISGTSDITIRDVSQAAYVMSHNLFE